MSTPGVTEVATLLRDFHFVDPTWEGTARAVLGGDLDVSIYPDEDGITPRQLAILQAILSYTQDLRPELERALFAYYQSDVYGTYGAYDDSGQPIPGSGPPKLTEPSQVWDLIDEPVVCILRFFRTPSAIELELSFNCEWDSEQGLGVLYRDWCPVKLGTWDL